MLSVDQLHLQWHVPIYLTLHTAMCSKKEGNKNGQRKMIILHKEDIRTHTIAINTYQGMNEPQIKSCLQIWNLFAEQKTKI